MKIIFRGDEKEPRRIIDIADKRRVRIETGPVIKTQIATRELLDDAVTAGHYFAPVMRPVGKLTRKIAHAGKEYYYGKPTFQAHADPRFGEGEPLVENGQPVLAYVHALDAVNKPIILGEPMTFADHYLKDRQWNIYVAGVQYEGDKVVKGFGENAERLARALAGETTRADETDSYWAKVDVELSEDGAMTKATALAAVAE